MHNWESHWNIQGNQDLAKKDTFNMQDLQNQVKQKYKYRKQWMLTNFVDFEQADAATCFTIAVFLKRKLYKYTQRVKMRCPWL